MKTMGIATVVLLGLLALSGCETGDSGDYATDQINCGFIVDVTDTEATATATFTAWSWTYFEPVYLVLTDYDRIYINGVKMTRVNALLFDFYAATVPPAGEYTFTFERDDGSSYDSTVATLPTLVLTSPEPGAEISRASDLTVSWTNPLEGGMVSITVRGDDDSTDYTVDVEDTGLHIIPGGTLLREPAAELTSAAVTLGISRSRDGAMAPGLTGGVSAMTGDSLEFISTE